MRKISRRLADLAAVVARRAACSASGRSRSACPDRRRWRCPCRAACRRHPRWPRCRSRRAHTGSRRRRTPTQSTTATPSSRQARILASAWPRVSWKCTASAAIGTSRGDCREHRARLGRRADADRVAERDLVATQIVQAPGDAHDVGDRHVALVRAAEHGRDIAAHAHAVGARALHDRHEAFDRFVDRGVDVLAVERFARGREHGDVGRRRRRARARSPAGSAPAPDSARRASCEWPYRRPRHRPVAAPISG